LKTIYKNDKTKKNKNRIKQKAVSEQKELTTE
jgi:hypothetical protein